MHASLHQARNAWYIPSCKDTKGRGGWGDALGPGWGGRGGGGGMQQHTCKYSWLKSAAAVGVLSTVIVNSQYRHTQLALGVVQGIRRGFPGPK